MAQIECNSFLKSQTGEISASIDSREIKVKKTNKQEEVTIGLPGYLEQIREAGYQFPAFATEKHLAWQPCICLSF